MHTVAVVLMDGVVEFDFAIPCEIFGPDRREIADPWYRLLVVGGRTRTQTGVVFEGTHGLKALARADTIIVPGATTSADPPQPLLRSLVRAHERGARIASVCVGAFVLAEAGLLDGRRATTHWAYAEDLQRRYPLVDVDPSVLYVDEGSVLTSAGVAAGVDLCLHLVAQDHGAEVAAAVARRLVMPVHRSGGQAQYIQTPVAPATSDLVDWASRHVGDGLTVDDLARHANVSSRTLTRMFRAATGLPPGEWLQQARLRRARQLLESTDLPVEQVARSAGYESGTTMRAQFTVHLRTSPRAYRRAFRPRSQVPG
jgi:AraC family transcriptional regulator, transcriptional activator FtrA